MNSEPEQREELASYEINFLDPRKVRFYRVEGDELRLDIENDQTVLSCTAIRAFPLSDPEHYIGIWDANGGEVGMLYELRQLDADSRREVEAELRKRYFVPIIQKIKSLRVEFGIVYWEVDTDKGERDFIVHGIRDNIIEIAAARYMIQDVDANRFEIPDLAKLDPKSQLLMERVT